MTSREHARRLMLILLASEGTALRKAADERTARRERLARGGEADGATGSDFPRGFIAPGRMPLGPVER